MRVPHLSITLACAALALAACQKAEPPAAQPHIAIPGAGGTHRAPGLWVEKVTAQGRSASTRYCLDDATDAKLAIAGRQMGESHCSRHVGAQDAAGSWRFSTVCDMGQWGKVSTETVMSGDFTKKYKTEATTSTSGAANPAANGRRRIVVETEFKGVCPKGMAPGDVILPNGTKANAVDLATATPAK